MVDAFSLSNILDDIPEYKGCYEDKEDSRMLKEQHLEIYHNSPENCGGLCKFKGYRYFGLQGKTGEWCYCGNSLRIEIKKHESDCHVKCPGDGSKKCGGIFKMNVYKFKDNCKIGNNFKII